jgi:hypothetical protein
MLMLMLMLILMLMKVLWTARGILITAMPHDGDAGRDRVRISSCVSFARLLKDSQELPKL